MENIPTRNQRCGGTVVALVAVITFSRESDHTLAGKMELQIKLFDERQQKAGVITPSPCRAKNTKIDFHLTSLVTIKTKST